MAHKVLVTTQMMINDQERFDAWLKALGFEADFVRSDQFLSEKECLEIAPIYSGWISGDDEISCRVIDHFQPDLKVISKWGSGLDSIDLDYAAKKGLPVMNSAGFFQDAVGEIAVAYLLALTRGIVKTHESVLRGEWPKKQFQELKEMSVGLLGMGAIGNGAAARLRALGCNTSYYDPNVEVDTSKQVCFDDLVTSSDAIIITCDLNSSTVGLFDRGVFAKMKKCAYLINVSRGPIVCFEDLLEALKCGEISGAALDVYETEPLPIGHFGLQDLNVVLGSHNANNTKTAVERVHSNTIENLLGKLPV